MKLGLSSFITQITIVLISLVCNRMLAKYGAVSPFGVDIPIAIIGIESKGVYRRYQSGGGDCLGCQPIIGYNIGARKYGRVRKLYRAILLCTVVVGLGSTLLFELAPHAVTALFRQSDQYPEPR